MSRTGHPSDTSLRERLAELTLELIRIPSVTGDEAALADYLLAWARAQPQLGADDVLRDGNAVAVGSPDPHRPCLALVGHTDTVPPHPDAPPVGRDSDRIVGRGASDMKGALAVMLALGERLELATLPFSLLLVFYDHEEGAYANNGLQPLLERYELLTQADLAIAMEPTDNTLQLGCVGGLQATVTFRGRAAHSARPWQGRNAIHAAGDFLSRLETRPVRDVEVGGLIFREVMSATMASGGQARNMVPDRFDINVNYRFAPRPPIDTAVERAIAELETQATGADIDIYDVAPPGPVPADNPLLRHLRSLSELPTQPKQAWTDVARMAQFGLDAINFGPGFAGEAHQKNEWVSLNALEYSYSVLHTLLTTPLPPSD